MKHYLLHVILMLCIAITPVYLYAENDTPIDVELIKHPDQIDNPRRSSPKRIHCVIDLNSGVTIEDADNCDIISYEIYTDTGNNIGIFADEQDFLSRLRDSTGTIRIVFNTSSASYSGHLSL